MKKTSSFVTFYLFILSTLLHFQVYAHNSEITIPEVKYINGIYEITLTAETPFDRGFQHGTALKTPIQQGILSFRQWIAENTSIKDVDSFLSKFIKDKGYAVYAKEKAPQLYEELQGIAIGADVSFDVLFAYQTFDELFSYFAFEGYIELQGHCTTVGVFGREKQPNIVTHNNDIPTYFRGSNTILRIKNPSTGHEIIQGTFAGVIGQNGINNKGLSVGINTVGNIKPNTTGLPVAFNVRKILEQASISDALNYLSSVQCAQPMNYMIGDQTEVMSVEVYGEGNYVTINHNSQFIVHTNHTLSDKTPLLFEMKEEDGGGSFANTKGRFDIATDWLISHASTATEKDIMRLKSSQQINVFPGSSTGRTLQSMIAVIPSEGFPYVYYTADSPSISEYVKFSFE